MQFYKLGRSITGLTWAIYSSNSTSGPSPLFSRLWKTGIHGPHHQASLSACAVCGGTVRKRQLSEDWLAAHSLLATQWPYHEKQTQEKNWVILIAGSPIIRVNRCLLLKGKELLKRSLELLNVSSDYCSYYSILNIAPSSWGSDIWLIFLLSIVHLYTYKMYLHSYHILKQMSLFLIWPQKFI